MAAARAELDAARASGRTTAATAARRAPADGGGDGGGGDVRLLHRRTRRRRRRRGGRSVITPRRSASLASPLGLPPPARRSSPSPTTGEGSSVRRLARDPRLRVSTPSASTRRGGTVASAVRTPQSARGFDDGWTNRVERHAAVARPVLDLPQRRRRGPRIDTPTPSDSRSASTRTWSSATAAGPGTSIVAGGSWPFSCRSSQRRRRPRVDRPPVVIERGAATEHARPSSGTRARRSPTPRLSEGPQPPASVEGVRIIKRRHPTGRRRAIGWSNASSVGNFGCDGVRPREMRSEK